MSVSTLPAGRMATVTPSAATFGVLLTVAGSPRLGPQPNSLDNAVSVATHWVRRSDGRRPDAMWLEAGAMMQKRVARSEWLRYLRRVRIDRGPLQSREWFEVTRVRDPVGLPEGDYLNVIFVSHFAHAAQYETVSLAPGAHGWLPVGYVVRPIQRDNPL